MVFLSIFLWTTSVLVSASSIVSSSPSTSTTAIMTPSPPGQDVLKSALLDLHLSHCVNHSDPIYKQLVEDISRCASVDDVLYACEHIPAIRRSVDKARRIISAEPEDAEVAVLALATLANLTQHSEAGEGNGLFNPSELLADRRFSQLQDCVELQLAHISINDVSKYLRASIVLGLEEGEDTYAVVTEHLARSLHSNVPIDDLIDVLWSLAMFKYAFGKKVDATLLSDLVEHIASSISLFTTSKFSFLHPSLSVSLLWSLSVHGVKDSRVLPFALTSLSNNQQFLSPADCVTVLWSLSKLELFQETALYSYLLEKIASDVGSSITHGSDIELVASSLFKLYSNMTCRPIQVDFAAEFEGAVQLCKNLLTVSTTWTSYKPGCLAQVLRVGAAMNLTTPETWEHVVANLLKAFKSNYSIKPVDAANLLESIATCFPNTEDAECQSPPADMPYLVGRLSTICAAEASALDLNTLITASWAVSELGHPYQALLRNLRKRAQFKIEEISPNALAKIILSIYAEERSTLYQPQGLGAKFDRDFVNQVLVQTLKHFNEISFVSDKVRVLVAAAGLGRTDALLGSSLQLELGPPGFKSISHSMLIRLLWAISRLKRGLLTDASLSALCTELDLRHGHLHELTLKDVSLLVRALANLRSCGDDSFASLNAPSSLVLLQILQQYLEIDQQLILSDTTVDARSTTLCDVMQSFLDLEWYNEGVETLISAYTHSFEVDQKNFRFGQLEELLLRYSHLALSKVSAGKFSKAKNLLSRFIKTGRSH